MKIILEKTSFNNIYKKYVIDRLTINNGRCTSYFKMFEDEEEEKQKNFIKISSEKMLFDIEKVLSVYLANGYKIVNKKGW